MRMPSERSELGTPSKTASSDGPSPSAPPPDLESMQRAVEAGTFSALPGTVVEGIPSALVLSSPPRPHYKSMCMTVVLAGLLVWMILGIATQHTERHCEAGVPCIVADDDTTSDAGVPPFVPGIVFAVWYVLYLIESCCADTAGYVKRIHTVDGAETYLEKMRDNPPHVFMQCECYHYETRTRVITETDSQGRSRTRTETYTVKVVTYRETDYWEYRGWRDESGASRGMALYPITKLKLNKLLVFADDESRAAFFHVYAAFQMRNRWRDVHFEHSWGMRINDYSPSLVALNDPRARPWWLSCGWYWIFTLVGGSWVFRRMLSKSSIQADYTLRKVIKG